MLESHLVWSRLCAVASVAAKMSLIKGLHLEPTAKGIHGSPKQDVPAMATMLMLGIGRLSVYCDTIQLKFGKPCATGFYSTVVLNTSILISPYIHAHATLQYTVYIP